jgi:undecaprenyl-diphosphatase
VLPDPVAHASGFSFPSGHALGSAALYASLAVVATARVPMPARLVLAVLPPVVVAATRVLLGVHFPSDVVAGLFLGWAIALLVAAAMRP